MKTLRIALVLAAVPVLAGTTIYLGLRRRLKTMFGHPQR